MAGRKPSPTVQYMGIRLVVQSSTPGDMYAEPKEFFPRDKEGGVYIGRAASNDLQLPHGNVSSVHCRIVDDPQSGVFCLEDASSNGTRIGQRVLASGERYALRDGDVILIPPYQITFYRGMSALQGGDAGQDGLNSTMQLKKDVVSRFLDEPEGEAPQLKVIAGEQKGRSFDLEGFDDFLIGRDSDCHLCLTDDAMSRRHAVIKRDWSGTTVRDLNSRNGVLINGRRLRAGESVQLSHGDQVSLGLSTIVFHDPFAAELEKKLKGVVVDGDNTIDGATMLPDQALAVAQQKKTAPPPSAKNIGIEEPVSGKWRVPKRPKKEEPKPEPKPQPKPEPAKPKPKPKPVAPAKASQPALPAAKAPPSKAAPASKKSPAQGKARSSSGQSIWLMVGVVIACILVIVLAMVLAFLL